MQGARDTSDSRVLPLPCPLLRPRKFFSGLNGEPIHGGSALPERGAEKGYEGVGAPSAGASAGACAAVVSGEKATARSTARSCRESREAAEGTARSVAASAADTSTPMPSDLARGDQGNGHANGRGEAARGHGSKRSLRGVSK